ncbi:uroporphyrinogen-III synthase [Flavobacterium endophyticum]|uniref:Uroporphyrinogen-III synthase n=1 Tax=Flavobacterium endophyticum TaxID=1540163 RepID=A0A495MKH2_9FLAO|nr:uroporphyrinogen-III synthase [Flavobacterium endophyticum]RKS26461.1 uroporphyrinogen-III synthase [Flavobacterium endophyticum]
MPEPIRILSTKKLLPNQKQFLLNANFSVIEADFIEIVRKDFELEGSFENMIFTSQNAVKSFLKNEKAKGLKDKKVFCVGIKTRTLLEENGYKVAVSREYASELSEVIVHDFQKESFVFFSGNLRRETLPETLKKSDIVLQEIEVYETKLTPQKINSPADALLFFSPSGVQSYLKDNKIENQNCFCIGTTTAAALEKITDKIIIAKQQTVENVIIQAINYYNKKL